MPVCYVCKISPSNIDAKLRHLSFHRFPRRYPEIMKQWMEFAQCPEGINPHGLFLCSSHFNESDIIHSPLKITLRPTAAPCQAPTSSAVQAAAYECGTTPLASGTAFQSFKDITACTVNDETSADLAPSLDSGDVLETYQEEVLEDVKKQLCRICGLRSEELSSIFSEAGTEEETICLEKKIKMYLPIELNADDGLPLNICSKCCDLVESWHELYVSCVAADSVLRTTFDINEDQAAFEGEVDPSEEKRLLEENEEPPLQMLDPLLESKEQSDNNKLSENSAVFSGNCNSKSDQMPTAANSKILPSVRGHYLYTCPHCSERFDSIQERSLHKKQCALVPSICDVCGKTLRNRRRLKIHRKKHFFVPVLCEKCGRQLHSSSSVLLHKEKCQGRGYFCEPCCKLFSGEVSLQAHQKLHDDRMKKHQNLGNFFLEDFSANDGEEGFICPVCGGRFQDKLSLVQHMNTESKSNCVQCMKPLQNEKEMFLHKCVKLACCYCCAEFADAKLLRQHKLIHKPDEPFTCKKCGSKFTSQLLFERHKNTHYSRGFFQCEKCGKQFSRRNPYREHMRIHEGIKYKCNYCDSSYFRRKSLYKHMRKYHPGTKNMRM